MAGCLSKQKGWGLRELRPFHFLRDFMNELDSLVESARSAFAGSVTPADLENAKAQFLGKTGRITELMKGMAALSVDEKKSRGAAINLAKQAIEAALTQRRQDLADAELQSQLKAEALDVSLPGRQRGLRFRIPCVCQEHILRRPRRPVP